MAANRNIQKTVRISSEVYNYINAYKGNNFNDCLNNLIIDLLHGRDKRMQQLNSLNAQIANRNHRLVALYKLFGQIQAALRGADA